MGDQLTVEQVLVILVVIKITTVLLDIRINAKRAGVHLLHAQIIGLELAVDLTLLSTISTCDPGALDILAANNMVPVRAGTAGMLLGQREHGSVVHRVGEVVRHFLPQLASLTGKGIEVVLELLERLRENVRTMLEGIRALLDDVLQLVLVDAHDLLERGGCRRGSSHQHGGGKKSHDGWFTQSNDDSDGNGSLLMGSGYLGSGRQLLSVTAHAGN